ncbi:delta-aminolevulinic acid dehydratase [Oxobacter pfennigii]|uniref:Delta-aminolevulinic acid dehydratase n=1 Tax=Oxobacter pfennigii TaxID=36849 RepID=A0A0N8NT21_9CLOT|nr:porphobilinogen synthase [Oxobacter pfennigii]KPU43616.1 delta-aminolevulinic acid dehydratase [Oxobacter pfennigii]
MFARIRRLRGNRAIREMVRETILHPWDFIFPVFVMEGTNIKEEIEAMPGNYHYTLDRLHEVMEEVVNSGVKGVLLFGLPGQKDEIASSAFDGNGIVQRAIKKIKEIAPELYVITDVCMCQYTSHGHCGILKGDEVDNDLTLPYIARIALSHAQAGADMVAPSDMMDGRISAIREALDENGFSNIPIMSYSMKYSSAFYGPFREAAHSAPSFGDRKTYQMDPANARQAMMEAEADIDEGADILMVKPALSYLDIIRMSKDRFDVPIAAYNVSGEFSMIKAAAKMGWINEREVVLEMLTSIKRAGADIIITYSALDACKWLKEENHE